MTNDILEIDFKPLSLFKACGYGQIEFGTKDGDKILSSAALQPFLPGPGREAYVAWVSAWKAAAGYDEKNRCTMRELYAHNMFALRRHARRMAAADYASRHNPMLQEVA